MSDGELEPLVRLARMDVAQGAAESFDRLQERLLAMPEEAVGRVTADVAHAAAVAMGALPRLKRLRAEFARLPDEGAASAALELLPDIARAAFYAHVQSVADSSRVEVLAQPERGKHLREQLLAAADMLVVFGVFDAAAVASIRDGSGDVDAATDLVALGALFSRNWEHVDNRLPFSEALVDEATLLGTRLLHALATAADAEPRDWSALRARAFRLLVNTYDELRRAVSYLRWHHGDTDSITPSLHARRRSPPSGPTRSERSPSPIHPSPPKPAEPSEPTPEDEIGFAGTYPFSD